MKISTINILSTFISCMIIFNSCSDQSSDSDKIPSEFEDIPLSEDQLSFLESARDTVIRIEDIILDNGQNVRSFLEEFDPGFLNTYPTGKIDNPTILSVNHQKNMFFARMFTIGNYLVDRTKHTFPSEGSNKPAQTGLAYSWGSKDYNIRQFPPGATGECKDLQIYGLDCSGMIWVMTQASFLKPVVPKNNFCVAQITDAKKWTEAFKASADYKDLRMKDMGELALNQIINGDIILWGSHVGIYLYGYFYQSNGSSKKARCARNLSNSCGPRLISLGDILGWGLGNYKVFRVMAPSVSGRISLSATINGTRTISYSGMSETKNEIGIANLVYNLSANDIIDDGVDSYINWNDAGFGGTSDWSSVHLKTYNYICDNVKDRMVTDKETSTTSFTSSVKGLQVTGVGLIITSDDSYNIMIGPSTNLTAATYKNMKEYSGYCINLPTETYESKSAIPFAHYFINSVGGELIKLKGKITQNQPNRLNGVYHGIDSIMVFDMGMTQIKLPLDYTLTWDLTLKE